MPPVVQYSSRLCNFEAVFMHRLKHVKKMPVEYNRFLRMPNTLFVKFILDVQHFE